MLLRFLNEVKNVLRLTDEPSPRRIAAYAEDTATWSVLGPFLEALPRVERADTLYVTSDPDDPRLGAPADEGQAVLMTHSVAWWMARIRARVLLTTMPDLGQLRVPRPPASTRCVYAFHSLVSTHEAYRAGAFDHYDVIFCAGPHHREELQARFSLLGRPLPQLVDVGYPRLDRLAAEFDARPRRTGALPTVVIAPSWGAGNILEAAGISAIEQLRGNGYRVIVRPHPCFWLKIYPRGRAVVQRVIDHFQADPEVVVERDINSHDSILDADLMVSDFSGAAYEYAFATKRPVLFFGGARKTRNPDWRAIGLPTFEDRMRTEVGEIVAAANIHTLGAVAARMLADGKAWGRRLAELHHQHVYHPGRSAVVGMEALRAVADRVD